MAEGPAASGESSPTSWTDSKDAGTSRSGSLVHFAELSLDDLPKHTDLPGDRADPTQFVETVVSEAVEALRVIFSDSASKILTTKSSPPGKAQVTLRKSSLTLNDSHRKINTPETWFSRESVHRPAQDAGTATLEEFTDGLFDDHSRKEAEYTTDIYDANLLVQWDDVTHASSLPQGCSAVSMGLWEMYHKIPLLTNRAFDTLVVCARFSDRSLGSFLVIQMAVDTSAFPEQLLQSKSHRRGTRHRNFAGKDESGAGGDVKWEEDGDVVLGQYLSMEHVFTKGEDVVWRMALISDAKGRLPMFVQNKSLPGKIANDVGLFMKWVEEKRGKSSAQNEGAPAS